jgi:putative transposase
MVVSMGLRMIMILSFRYRLKDGGKRDTLKHLAGQCNFVWNFTNEIIRRRWKESRFYTSRSDLNPLLKGSSKDLEINSQTIQAIAYECLLRVQKSKKQVRFRTGKKNLGWVPFNGQTVKFHGGYIDYNGFRFRLWHHRKIPEGFQIKTGSFSEDARGRWYVNLTCELPDEHWFQSPSPIGTELGLDPGMKTVLTTSEGSKLERENLTKAYAVKLAKAQQHRKKKQIKALHAKIKNSRLDWNHKRSFELAKHYQTIFIGDASPGSLGKTKMAKGVYDAGWYQIKTFLSYKSLRRGGRMLEVNERNSTVTCSSCLEKTGPSGLGGLGIREWTCRGCGAIHDRDVNAAKNILRVGRYTLSLRQNA